MLKNTDDALEPRPHILISEEATRRGWIPENDFIPGNFEQDWNQINQLIKTSIEQRLESGESFSQNESSSVFNYMLTRAIESVYHWHIGSDSHQVTTLGMFSGEIPVEASPEISDFINNASIAYESSIRFNDWVDTKYIPNQHDESDASEMWAEFSKCLWCTYMIGVFAGMEAIPALLGHHKSAK